MADTVPVPHAPALMSIPGVQLAQAGSWRLSSGEAAITRHDLAAAVGAVDCPAVRNPVLKLGHVDPRFDGEPAVGWIDNMLLADSGNTIVGDYRGMPAWLASILPSAYPDRSIEASREFRCQIGHTHQMVITAVALLGVVAPGIGTLDSLQDIADLYQVAASADGAGQPITLKITGGGLMPQPQPDPAGPGPVQVAAGVTSEDVRRRYYEQTGWSRWICEIQLDPALQLIVTDDDNGSYYRVPVGVDGDDVTFDDPVAVSVEYVDKPTKVAAAVFASRAESVPADLQPAADPQAPTDPPPVHNGPAPQTPVADPASGQNKEDTDMQFSDEQLAALRAKLDLPADADIDPDAVLAGVEKLAASEGSPGKTPKNRPGTVTVDQQVWDDLQTRIRKLEDIRASQQRNDRERAVDEAIRAGKFAPSRRDHWLRVYEADAEGTSQLLAGLTPGSIPVSDLGLPGDDDLGLDNEFATLFPPAPKGA